MGSLVEEKKVKKVAEKAAAKPKAAGKAPAKPLPQLMEEDVIPSLKAILEADEDITELELSFQDNRVRLVILSPLMIEFLITISSKVHHLFISF